MKIVDLNSFISIQSICLGVISLSIVLLEFLLLARSSSLNTDLLNIGTPV